MALGLYLSAVPARAHTGTRVMSLDILVLGAGIGLCVQVLTIIVQARITFLRTSASHVGERLWSCRSGLPPARKHSV